MARLKALPPRIGTASVARLPVSKPAGDSWGKGRGGRPWRRLRQKILLRDLYICQHCGRVCPENELVADHIINRARGGTDDENNLQALCVACHKIKTQAESQGVG